MNITTLIWTNAFSLLFGASLTFGVQYILNRQKAKLDFKQKQLSELYQPLHELISKNAMVLTIDKNDKEESYDLAYSIIELITKKSCYSSKELRLSIHSLRHHLKIENYNYKSLDDTERKIKVWSFKEDENGQKLDDILEVIYRDIEMIEGKIG